MSNDLKPYKSNAEWILLEKVVNMAIIDDYDDGQVMRQRFNNWAIRACRKLNLNLLRIVKTALIPISTKTGTAHLPPDFRKYITAGYYDECGNLSVFSQVDMVEYKENQKCGCDKCSCSSTSLCDAVSYERVEEVVQINGQPYTNVIIRRINKETGIYTEQKEEWVFIQNTGLVEKRITSTDLCYVKMLECGCVEETKENINKLKECGCYGIWGYCAPHRFCTDDYFSIDKENGLIHVGNTNARRLYLKYLAFLPCVDGKVYVPAVAAETIAAFVLMKRDERRKGIPDVQKERSSRHYKAERAELRKNLFPIRLSVIENALNLIPH